MIWLFSIVADKLQVFMLSNKYIPREVQKGFLAGVPGCLEHSFALYEALREAKEEQRRIVTSSLMPMEVYAITSSNLRCDGSMFQNLSVNSYSITMSSL